ncbi:MAG: menaquinone biosynthesis protein [Fuerstiella sp.]|nr:menaquinone biosynthesis protein [Fuerstiella sp.]
MINPHPAAVRLGAVSYLNSKPLIEDLEDLLPEAEIILDYPSRLSDALAAGQLDVALIPSVEYFRGSGYRIISNACVAARGPVMSVKLYCRVHPGEIRRLAMDEGSRTSAALSRVILAERYGVFPEGEPLPIESSTLTSTADAVLLIGDRAMHEPIEEFVEVMDLGQMWYKWTGLPFVFAMWVAREGADITGIERTLDESRDRGVAALHRIADEQAPLLDLSRESATTYLTQNLNYHLASAERSGLELFRQLAQQQGLLQPEAVAIHSDADLAWRV